MTGIMTTPRQSPRTKSAAPSSQSEVSAPAGAHGYAPALDERHACAANCPPREAPEQQRSGDGGDERIHPAEASLGACGGAPVQEAGERRGEQHGPDRVHAGTRAAWEGPVVG